MSNPHDEALRAYVPEELQEEFDRLHPKPKRRQREPEPEPPKDDRQLVGESDGLRVYARQQIDDVQQQTAEQYAQRLRESHWAWEQSGYPPDGPVAETLMYALADAYMVAPPDSPEEQELAQYAEAIGAEHVVEAATAEYNRAVNRHVNAEEGEKLVTDLWAKDPAVAAKLKEIYESDPDYLAAIAAGDVSLEEVRENLGELRATVEESTLADRRYEERTQLDEAFVRESGLTMDERAEAQYRRELAEATVKATTVTPEDVVTRREKLLGRSSEPEPFPLSDDVEQWKREGLIVDPAEDEERMRRGREIEEDRRTEAADRAEGR